MRTFKHDFGNGVVCTLEVHDALPEDGQGSITTVTWQGKPGNESTRRYIAWVNSVNLQLAKEWNVSLAHAFMLKQSEWEVWGYWPGKPPKRLGIVRTEKDLLVAKALADKLAKRMGLPGAQFTHLNVEQ